MKAIVSAVGILALPLIAGCATTPAQMYSGRPPISAAVYNPGSYYSAIPVGTDWGPASRAEALRGGATCTNCGDTYKQEIGPTSALCSNTHENPNRCIRPANEGNANNVFPGMLPDGARAVPTGNGHWWVHW